jgi:hypothetical protein
MTMRRNGGFGELFSWLIVIVCPAGPTAPVPPMRASIFVNDNAAPADHYRRIDQVEI